MPALPSNLDQSWLIAFAIIMLIIGVSFIQNVMDGWRKSINAMNSPLSITLKTEKTPADILAAAQAARAKRRLFIIVSVIVLYLILHIINPELAKSIDTLLFQLMNSAFEALSWLFQSLAEIVNSYAEGQQAGQ